MFDEMPKEICYEDQVEEHFRQVMINDPIASYAYNSAKACGLGESYRLKCVVVLLSRSRRDQPTEGN